MEKELCAKKKLVSYFELLCYEKRIWNATKSKIRALEKQIRVLQKKNTGVYLFVTVDC